MRDVWGQYRYLMRGRTFHTLQTIFHTYFSPREARFLLFLRNHPEIVPEIRAFEVFEEHIPFTRREDILSHFRHQLRYAQNQKNKAISDVFWKELESYSHNYPHPPLQRHEFVLSYSYEDS